MLYQHTRYIINKLKKMETEKTYRLPNWGVILIAIVVGLMVWYITRPDPEGVKVKQKQKTTIQSKIDSLTGVRTKEIKNVVSHSKTQAVKSDSLLKTIKHEKIIVTDTTYSAMFEYIANYKQ